MSDQTKKSVRQFQCRDYLWEIFEQMSGELECSVDYLVNEAMRQYAKARNYGGAGSPSIAPAFNAPPDFARGHGDATVQLASQPPGLPSLGLPSLGQPSFGQPPMGQPPMGQPPMGQPPMGQPPMGQAIASIPGMSGSYSGALPAPPGFGTPPGAPPPFGQQQPYSPVQNQNFAHNPGSQNIGQPNIGQPNIGQPNIGQPPGFSGGFGAPPPLGGPPSLPNQSGNFAPPQPPMPPGYPPSAPQLNTPFGGQPMGHPGVGYGGPASGQPRDLNGETARPPNKASRSGEMSPPNLAPGQSQGFAGPPPLNPPGLGAPNLSGGFASPPASPSGSFAGPSNSRPTLYAIYEGERHHVNKDEFIIGRGAKQADLPIKDGNISRRHAAVIWENGAFHMQDLGSTNGVEFMGQKVGIKKIEEGDRYKLCDHEIYFTYR